LDNFGAIAFAPLVLYSGSAAALRRIALFLGECDRAENYFGADGKPEVRIRKGRKSGKPTKRYLSLRRFQKSLGLAPSLEASGDKSKIKIVGGSDLCRIARGKWVFTRIEVKRCRINNEIGKILGARLDAEKAAGRPVRLVRSRCLRLLLQSYYLGNW
jgi:hypothetical protein